MTSVIETRPSGTPERDVSALRRIGALPPVSAAVAVPTKALHAPPPATGRVIAHLDPGQLRAPGKSATVYSYGPSRVDSYVGDFAVWKSAGYDASVLQLELWGQPSATDVIVSIRLSVGAEVQVRISATGNPIPMLLTGVSSAPLTIHVPMVASPAYSAVILEPVGPDDGFLFWSADFRLL